MSVQTPLGPRGLVSFATTFDQPWQRVKYYLGPKEFDTLAATDRELTRVINFGIFSWLVVPLLRSLNWINSFVGNYGWSIILLTILINAAMFPLRHKSVVSMRRLQELQPQVKAIQDRYANVKMTDPSKQQMNQEMMALYREKGVNPASGCIPMLLTFPVLLAFYSLLSQSIEIRGAGFMGWIHDLSTYDPLFRDAHPHGRNDGVATADYAIDGGSDTAEGDDVHAAAVHLHVRLGAQRSRDLLAGVEPVGDRAAVSDQLSDRPAGGEEGGRAGRAPDEES